MIMIAAPPPPPPMMLSMPAPDENQAEAAEETASPSGGGAFKGITADAITSAASALKRTDTAAAKPKEDARSEMLKFISNKKVCARNLTIYAALGLDSCSTVVQLETITKNGGDGQQEGQAGGDGQPVHCRH